MSAGGSGRSRGGHEEEEHESSERWLVSYADMVTLLMVTFIVMFAISSVDAQKFEQLKGSLSAGFGGPSNPVTAGGTSIMENESAVPNEVGLVGAIRPDLASDDAAVAQAKQELTIEERQKQQQVAEDARVELNTLNGVRDKLAAALDSRGLGDAVDFRITEDGLDVILVADDVFFTNASAALEPGGVAVLDAIGPVLATIDRDIDVEGHANHLPISGGIYPSNWELSAARAASVVRYFVQADGIADDRLSATGYSSSRPLVPIDDPTALERNRRTDVLVASTASAEVRALLPTLSAAQE